MIGHLYSFENFIDLGRCIEKIIHAFLDKAM